MCVRGRWRADHPAGVAPARPTARGGARCTGRWSAWVGPRSERCVRARGRPRTGPARGTVLGSMSDPGGPAVGRRVAVQPPGGLRYSSLRTTGGPTGSTWPACSARCAGMTSTTGSPRSWVSTYSQLLVRRAPQRRLLAGPPGGVLGQRRADGDAGAGGELLGRHRPILSPGVCVGRASRIGIGSHRTQQGPRRAMPPGPLLSCSSCSRQTRGSCWGLPPSDGRPPSEGRPEPVS